MKLKIITAFMFSLGLIAGLNAQETISSTGGEASGEGGSISYTIGQLVYSTLTGTNNNSIAQGVQQAFEISVVSGIAEAEEINLEVLAYPNPATDFVTLKINDVDEVQYMAFMYNINGRLIKNIEITDYETQIAMHDLVPSIYFLKVIKNEKEVKVFKIIKK